MLPSDLVVIMGWLDSPECIEGMSELRRLYFKAFATTAFALWARYIKSDCYHSLIDQNMNSNEELVNLQAQHIRLGQVSPSGCPYTEFRLVFRKTNKDATKGACKNS